MIAPGDPGVQLPAPSESAPAPPSKPKSRFALQREKEAEEKAQQTQRFELDLEGEDTGEAGPSATSLGDRIAQSSVVKGILERPTAKKATPPAPPSATGSSRPHGAGGRPTGFPAPARGVFPRGPEHPSPTPSFPSAATAGASAHSTASSSSLSSAPPSTDADALLQDVSRENEGILRGMSEAEILEEQRQIREDLGLSEGMIKMLQARAEQRAGAAPKPSARTPRIRPPVATPAPAPALERTADLEDEEAEEEGTPEYIRRHFFPNEPPNPALDWMKPARFQTEPAAGSAGPSSTVAFNLKGEIVTGDSSADRPAGGAAEHHVGSTSTFTIPSLLALTASSVPRQRITALNLLRRILELYDAAALRLEPKELVNLRADCATSASHALREGNVGVVAAAIGLLFAVCSAELSALPQQAVDPPMPTSIATLLEAHPFPRLAEHLSLDTLPRVALLDIVRILGMLASLARYCEIADALDATVSTPGLLDSVSARFLATPWPPSDARSDTLPELAASTLLVNLARTSRKRAKVVAGQALVESHLRFLALPPWELEPDVQPLAYDLVCATFTLWETLGRYGLATTLRTQAGDLLDAFSQRIADLRRQPASLASVDYRWIERYLTLLSVWTTAAIDPHVTGHDITWSQVEAWRDVALDAHFLLLDDAAREKGASGALAAAWELLGSWLEGSKTNKSWRGEHERRWVGDNFGDSFRPDGQARRVYTEAVMALLQAENEDEPAARVAAAALRLSEAYFETSDPPTPHLVSLEDAANLVRSLSSRTPGPYATAALQSALRRVPSPERLGSAIVALPLFTPADAVGARDLVEEIISAVTRLAASETSSLDAEEQQAQAQAGSLRPFVTHAIVTASGGRVVGPVYPTSRDIKLTACLAPYASTRPLLRPDWPLSVLDELLRSADSLVFQRLPADWNVSEVQLVRSALVLTRFNLVNSGHRMDPTALVYDLIKVFMLEKDNSGTTVGSSGAEGEVFRDGVVQRSLSALLKRLSVGARGPQTLQADARSSLETLEGVSAQISSAPFFQLYQDLVGLYDAISLSDRNFGLVLLPALAMSYPVDYRRLLWTDFAHLLPHLSFSLQDVLSDTGSDGGVLSAYLAPRETSAPVLMAYLEALLSARVTPTKTPFLHLVAVHHLSGAIFETAAEEAEEKRLAERLARTLQATASAEVLARVVGYRQATREGEPLVLPPDCFEGLDEATRGRRSAALEELTE